MDEDKGKQKAKKPKKTHGDAMRGITDRAIERLVHRANVERISKDIYPVIRMYIVEYFRYLINKIIILTENCRRKTLKMLEVEETLRYTGIELGIVVNPKTKTSSIKSCAGSGKTLGKSDKSKLKLQQKYREALSIPKANFEELVREITLDYGQYRYSENQSVIDILQLRVEEYIIDICKNAYIITKAAKRNTLAASDLTAHREITKYAVRL